MITFTIPDEMSNDQLERVLVAIEATLVGYDFGQFAPEAIQEAVNDHGEAAVYELIGSYLASWVEVCAQKEPLFGEECYKERAREHLLAVNLEGALEELHSYRRASGHYLGKVATRCENCGMLRHGLEWLDKPTPDDFHEVSGVCPDCDKLLSRALPPRPEPSEDDLREWLAEAELVEV